MSPTGNPMTLLNNLGQMPVNHDRSPSQYGSGRRVGDLLGKRDWHGCHLPVVQERHRDLWRDECHLHDCRRAGGRRRELTR